MQDFFYLEQMVFRISSLKFLILQARLFLNLIGRKDLECPN